MEAISLATLTALAGEHHGFGAERLDLAVTDLKAKDLLVDFGDGRVKLTADGFLRANT